MNKNLNQLQEILDIAGVILVVLNTDESIALINKKGCDTLGFTREELIGKSYFDNFIEEAHRDQLKFVFKQIIKGELDGSASYENKVLTKSGCCRIIKWSNSFLKDSQGNIIATISSVKM
jgi:PAS domain S-box-containing protein